jgi:hypothetical protein
MIRRIGLVMIAPSPGATVASAFQSPAPNGPLFSCSDQSPIVQQSSVQLLDIDGVTQANPGKPIAALPSEQWTNVKHAVHRRRHRQHHPA